MVAIKNMKMPSSCYDCPFVKNERTNDYGSFCECGILEDYETINLLEHSKHPNCPLVEQASILDKIRAEIVEVTKCPYGTECLGANCPSNTDCMICGDHVLEIIDKYKAESEDK